jgi:hypothetical protein
MSTDRPNHNETTNCARFAATLLFVMLVGVGYTVSPHVKGAVEFAPASGQQDIMEPEFFPSECAVDGLVFSDCNLDF